MSHTPGPWHEDRKESMYEGFHSTRIASPSGAGIARVHRLDAADPSDSVEAIANSRLITAAPDLLASLRLCVASLADHIVVDAECAGIAPNAVCPCETDTLPKARAAIAKAEGRGS